MQLSHRVRRLPPSATLAVAARARALAEQGVDVVSMSLGQPDFDTPQPIKDAAVTALEAGMTGYAPPPGDPETRAVIADKLQRENNLQAVEPDSIVVTPGAKHAIHLTLQALLDPPAAGEPQQEVVVPTPAWVSYRPMIELAGGRAVEVHTDAEHGYTLTPEQLRTHITPLTRVVILNSPCNPTGAMYTPEELRALAAVVEEAAQSVAPDLVVLSDEIYEKLTLTDVPHFSIGSVEAIAQRVVTINGLSKAYAMTGWRLGYLAGQGDFGVELARACARLQGQMNTCVTSFTLPAVRAALRDCAEHVEAMRQAFVRRAQLASGLLEAIPGLSHPRPAGAFYAFVDVSAHFGATAPNGCAITSPTDFAAALLEEQHVAVVPGEAFGGAGERCVRVSFALSDDQLREGLARLDRFVRSLRR